MMNTRRYISGKSWSGRDNLKGSGARIIGGIVSAQAGVRKGGD